MAMDTGSVIWSEKAYRLRDFHKHFELPQLVCVEDGYYDEKDETTLSRDDVLTLHVLQKVSFYKAVDKNGKEFHIPVNLEATVETVSCEVIRTYHSIKELISVSAKIVKSIHNHPWLLIQAGDTLRVHEVCNDRRGERLRFSFISRQQDDVNIPIDYKGDFQVLPDIKRLWLTEVEETLELPVRIRFTDKTLQIKPDEDGGSCEDLSTIADLGEVTLQSIHQTDQFVASTRNENRTMVLKIPANTDITVKAGVGIEQGDYTYVEVCQYYHERARLYQLDDLDVGCIRIGQTNTKVERIYEFVDEFSDEDDEHDYEDMPPEIPSRTKRAPLHPEKEHSSDDDDDDVDDDDASSDDYEEPIISPPIPTRSTSLPQNSNINRSTITSNQNLCTRIMNALPCLRTASESQSNSAKKANSYNLEVPDDQGRYVEDNTIRSNTASFNERPNLEAFEKPVNNTALTEFPERLDSLDVEGVIRCLKALNMDQHVEKFKKEQINGSLFATLTKELLNSLGVINKFQQAKLLKFIHEGWRPDQFTLQN